MTQEAFLRAYAALPHSRTELAFKPWLFQIAVNLCRDLARKKRPDAFTDLAQEDEAAPEETIEDEAPLPLDQIEERELERALARAVAESAGSVSRRRDAALHRRNAVRRNRRRAQAACQHRAHASVPSQDDAAQDVGRLGTGS